MERNPFSECKYSLLQGEEELVNEIMDEQKKIDKKTEQQKVEEQKTKPQKTDKYPEIQDENDSFCSFSFLNAFFGWRFFPSF